MKQRADKTEYKCQFGYLVFSFDIQIFFLSFFFCLSSPTHCWPWTSPAAKLQLLNKTAAVWHTSNWAMKSWQIINSSPTAFIPAKKGFLLWYPSWVPHNNSSIGRSSLGLARINYLLVFTFLKRKCSACVLLLNHECVDLTRLLALLQVYIGHEKCRPIVS